MTCHIIYNLNVQFCENKRIHVLFTEEIQPIIPVDNDDNPLAKPVKNGDNTPFEPVNNGENPPAKPVNNGDQPKAKLVNNGEGLDLIPIHII